MTLAALTTFSISSAVFADTLTVTFSPAALSSDELRLSGSQHTVWVDTETNKTYTYDGTFVASASGGAAQKNTYCVFNPDTLLSFMPAGTGSLDLKLGSPMCFTNAGMTTNFQIMSGTGAFKGATGGGSAVYQSPTSIVFTGNFNPLSSVSATPELDSLLLFGTGALGLAGYGLTRLRAGRKSTSA
ncbi:MAG TPA: hypothetical protein VGQ62_08455 [Chloroflexota bacterium]|jgi:hypothetical protein|nr:hypothetical protein [Chloroflexota bacterium]